MQELLQSLDEAARNGDSAALDALTDALVDASPQQRRGMIRSWIADGIALRTMRANLDHSLRHYAGGRILRAERVTPANYPRGSKDALRGEMQGDIGRSLLAAIEPERWYAVCRRSGDNVERRMSPYGIEEEILRCELFVVPLDGGAINTQASQEAT